LIWALLRLATNLPLLLLCGPLLLEDRHADCQIGSPVDMRLAAVIVGLLPLLLPSVQGREQQVFSISDVERQISNTITRNHAQPWSLLLSLDLDTSSCVVLQPVELAQPHRSLQASNDVQVISKSPSRFDGTDLEREATLEILALDETVLWAKANELCSRIEYEYFSDYATLAEYEVVSNTVPKRFDMAEKDTLFRGSIEQD
jgi:hypothetical protein